MRVRHALPFAFLIGCGASIEVGGVPGPHPTVDAAGSLPNPGGPDLGAAPDAIDCTATPQLCSGDSVVTIDKFDPSDDGSSGVKLDKGGGLTIDPGNFGTSTAPIIWIANSAEGTLSKIETRSQKEVARYRAGPGNAPDPSRTTVGLGGDVVVGDRFADGATKIAADPVHCIDKNGNGKIDTSTGPKDVRPWGEDECVLWHVDFPKGSIARAAAFDASVGQDGDDSSTVWIGLYGRQEMRQLDSKTGMELANVNVAPVRPYGAAVDKDGNVWVRGGGLVKIDPKHNVTHYGEQCGYGLAVDPQGRVWTAGQGCVGRFTPGNQKWETVGVGGFNRGLAVDAKGSVWVADTDFGVHQIDMNTMQVKKNIGLQFSNFVGMAIDFDGMVWTVSQGSSRAIKIDPNTYVASPVQTGGGPYTYSDMTGFQLRNAAAPFGKYRHLFQGCGKEANGTAFTKISWMASLPVGATVVVKGRVGADIPSVQAAPWVLLATSPPDAPPIDIAAKFPPKGNLGSFFEVEITLKALNDQMLPILQSMSLSMSCTPGIG